MHRKNRPYLLRFIVYGAVAGSFSAFTFALIHDILISNIWFSLLAMLTAGSLCGICLGGSYALLVDTPSLRSWIVYNLLYVTTLFLLGVVSVIVFEPVNTIPALIAANGPPEALIRQALPMTVVFTMAAAVVLSLLYTRSWLNFGAILLTTTVLVLLLGLNLSALGLVTLPRGSLYLIAEMLGLVFSLGAVFVGVFAALTRKDLIRQSHNP
jgi:hypothetical protein